jgi:hypothetical protein
VSLCSCHGSRLSDGDVHPDDWKMASEVLLVGRGVDMTVLRCGRVSEEARCLKEYELELAQGALHIASMLCAESIHAAVEETSLLFEILHGRDHLKLFLRALAERLEQCGKLEAVTVLRELIERGQSRAIDEHWAMRSFDSQLRSQKTQRRRAQKGNTPETAIVARKRRRA